ncbi:hypothetical protein SAMN04488522_104358 [Pedobacter caeni]|uniref:Uncharacterized protein n=1 Tax=Pedobacter caeni TaxID=288992 RepID=A0A1M5GT31_9SPHI|nr:hypothetical protein SAMN04488522_104358 [Pedobacter caeni]
MKTLKQDERPTCNIRYNHINLITKLGLLGFQYHNGFTTDITIEPQILRT